MSRLIPRQSSPKGFGSLPLVNVQQYRFRLAKTNRHRVGAERQITATTLSWFCSNNKLDFCLEPTNPHFDAEQDLLFFVANKQRRRRKGVEGNGRVRERREETMEAVRVEEVEHGKRGREWE